ncbi:MAG TPA: energy transducer TonB [Burkholderiales bacterium]
MSQPAPGEGALNVRLVPASEFQSPASDNPVPAADAVHAIPPRQRLLPVSVYFPASQLDVQAEVLNDVMLHYPLEAFRQGLRGEVTLKLLISRDGRIDKVTVIDARPKDIFDEAAIAAALQLRYSAAIKDGIAVGAMKKVTITFDPTDQAL